MSDRIFIPYDVIIQDLLSGSFWPEKLVAGTRYARVHDDCDGDMSQQLSVVIGEDGDAWIAVDAPDRTARFRMPFTGGGASPRVRTALVVLAEAIRLDNIDCPLLLNHRRSET